MGLHLKTSKNQVNASSRRGFSLVEVTIAVVMLIAAMSMTVEVVTWVARGRRSADRHAVALREAANLVERITAGIDEGTNPPKPSAEARRALPDVTIKVDRVRESINDMDMLRIDVTVRYRDVARQPAAPVRLTTWVAATGTGHDRDGGTSP